MVKREAAAAFALLALIAPASAQLLMPTPAANVAAPSQAVQTAATEKPSTPKTFGDWQLRCQTLGTPPKTQVNCEIVQSVLIKDQTTPFAQIAFGKPAPDAPLLVTVVVPINVQFPSAVRIAVSETDPEPSELAWRHCVPAGCFANLPVKEETLKRWKNLATTGRIGFKSAAGQDVILPISFKGLAQALEELAKQH